jgi:uncharacterized membrane protein YeaQ/YmgE (transglycosylase-associated protein family)
MKYITPIAIVAIVLLQLTGAIPQSSVGGPMTLAMVFLLAALAVGIHDAWSNKRRVVGWIVSIVVALVGAFLAASLGGMFMETMLQHTNLQGSLANTRDPLLYVVSAGMMLITLLGAWIALWLVNRLR